MILSVIRHRQNPSILGLTKSTFLFQTSDSINTVLLIMYLVNKKSKVKLSLQQAMEATRVVRC
jgi:hypothetical protein